MNIKSRIVLVVAVIAVLFLVGWTSTAQPSSREWEYKVVTVQGFPELPPPKLEKFNELGDVGWELVTVVREDYVRGGRPQAKLDYYFKRGR